jgi:phosphatidate cytidylyltransferase
MLTRAISGLIYVSIIVLSTYFGGLTLQIVFGLITVLLLYEFTALFKKSEYAPHGVYTPLYGLLLYTLGVFTILNPFGIEIRIYLFASILLFSSSFICFGLIELMRATKKPIANTALSVAALIYIVPPMLFVVLMSKLGPDREANIFPLLGIFIMIWCYDTFAYLIGKKFGKTKMAEKISPNKSWEGFIGGLVFAVISGLIIAHFQLNKPYSAYAILGMIAAGFGMLGDLFESLIKRQLGLKDSGTMMPGHGGILDRFDSVLFVMPIAFATCLIFMIYLS